MPGKDKAVAVEIKRQKKNYKPDLLEKKVEHLKHKVLPHYAITKMCLSTGGHVVSLVKGTGLSMRKIHSKDTHFLRHTENLCF